MAQSSIGFLFDENLSPKICSVLRVLGEKNIETVARKFGEGAQDQDWLPRAAEYGYIYITCDRNQLADQGISQILIRSKVRAVFLSARISRTPKWEQILWVLNHWRHIKSETQELERGEIRFVRWDGKVVKAPKKRRPPQRQKRLVSNTDQNQVVLSFEE